MPSSDRTEIGLIVVNYNSAQVTAQLLADLVDQDGSEYLLKVAVADNSPSASDLASLRSAYQNNPSVCFERMTSNLGYFGAAHQALSTVWKDRMPDWIIVSNADIRLPDKGFLSKVANIPREAGDVIAPRIVSARTRLDQNPFHRRRPTALQMNLIRVILRVPFLYWLLRTQSIAKRSIRRRLRRKHPRPTSTISNIYAPHGAFIIFNREYFQRGGTINVGAFLFAEEIFVAETCSRLALSVAYMPGLEVLHDEHVSTNGNPAIRLFQISAADYCFREFFAKPTK